MLINATEAVTEPSDAELVRCVAQGDTAALGALYDRHSGLVYRVALSIGLETSEAEDVVHDVYLLVWQRASKFSESGSFEGWLLRVAVRLILSQLRTSRRRGHKLRLLASNADSTNPSAVSAARLDVERLLAKLSPGLRAVVSLKELQGCTHREVSDALGISVAASKVRLYRAMRVLREQALYEWG